MRRTIIILAILILGAGQAFGATLAQYTFESTTEGWSVGAKDCTEAEPSGGSCSLKITSGTVAILSLSPINTLPAADGDIIRVTGWVKRAHARQNTTFGLRFHTAAGGYVSATTEVSSAYDAVTGGWQRLTGTVTASGATIAYVHTYLNRLTADDNDTTWIDNVTISTDTALESYYKYTGQAAQAALAAWTDVHPRLFVDADNVTTIKSNIGSGYGATLWGRVKDIADTQTYPRAGTDTTEPDTVWPSTILEQRELGFKLARLSFAYLLATEGDGNGTAYLRKATVIATAAAAQDYWSAGDTNHIAGIVAIGVSMFYDYCYSTLSAELKTAILGRLYTFADTNIKTLASGNRTTWWKNSYMCNQFSIGVTGLLAVGLATFDNQTDDAPMWIQAAMDKFSNLYATRSSDGAPEEGIGYWGYDMDSLLKGTHLLKQILGVDYFASSSWLENTGYYRLYLGVPRNSWSAANQMFDFDDSDRNNWYGPDNLLYCLAGEYNNPYYQWLAGQIAADITYTDDLSEWTNLIWYNSGVSSTAPTALPTYRYFDNMDVVAMRSGWDGAESVVVIKAGPVIGHDATTIDTNTQWYTEHEHLAAGHFLIFGAGEWQLRDDGYNSGNGYSFVGGVSGKVTKTHNTLTLSNDLNQVSPSTQYNSQLDGIGVSSTASTTYYDIVKANLGAAYPSDNMTSFERVLLYLKPDIVLVLDDIVLPASHRMDLILHPQSTLTPVSATLCTAAGSSSNLRIENLSGGGTLACSTETYALTSGSMTMPTYRLTKTAATWRNATAISWATGTPSTVTLAEVGNVWTFTTGDGVRSITYNWDTGEVSDFTRVWSQKGHGMSMR